jgi:6-phosphogluconate dehydrogenase
MVVETRNIGIIGSDGVAQQLALSFSKSGFNVSLLVKEEEGVPTTDPAGELQERIDSGRVLLANSYKDLTRDVKLSEVGRRVFLLTFSSKELIKETLDQMSEDLVQGDIILDGDLDKIAGLRHRQASLGERGITFIDMNVPKDEAEKSNEGQKSSSKKKNYSAAEHKAVLYVLEITNSCLQKPGE